MIESFAQGHAISTDLRMLRELLGVCACSVDFGVGPEAKLVCRKAAVILATMDKNQTPAVLLRMDDAQVAVMRELQGYHDLQRAALTWGDYLKVIERTMLMLADPAPSVLPLLP